MYYIVFLSNPDQLFSLQSVAFILQIQKWILLSCVFVQLLACTFSSLSSRHNPQLLTAHPAQQCLYPVLTNIPSDSFCHSLKLSLHKLWCLWVSIREEEEQNELGVHVCGGAAVQIILSALQSVAASAWPCVSGLLPSLLTFPQGKLSGQEQVWRCLAA